VKKYFAEMLESAKAYDQAIGKYKEAIKEVVGEEFEVPQGRKGGMKNEVYRKMTVWEKVSVMACCNGIALCLEEKGDVPQVCWCFQI